jgi:hypothetical protein
MEETSHEGKEDILLIKKNIGNYNHTDRNEEELTC